jgi:hypothetical protein
MQILVPSQILQPLVSEQTIIKTILFIFFGRYGFVSFFRDWHYILLFVFKMGKHSMIKDTIISTSFITHQLVLVKKEIFY